VDWAEGERVQSLVEQRYRCQISLHLSEYDEATQPPSIATNARSYLFVLLPCRPHPDPAPAIRPFSTFPIAGDFGESPYPP